MSKTSPTFTRPEFVEETLNRRAARVLGLPSIEVETVNARPISHAEVESLVSSRQPEFDGYLRDEAGFLAPTTFTVKISPSRGFDHKPVPAAIPNPKSSGPEMIADRHAVAGHMVRLVAHTVFDHREGLRLYTTAEAQESVRVLDGVPRRGFDAARVYVADRQGDLQPLMPTYGAEANVSLAVAGLDAEEIAARVRRALEAEFGDDLRSNTMRVRSRLIENRRVDVFTADGDHEPLAIGILAAEVSLVMDSGRTAIETRSHKPTGTNILVG